jgi:hypothetical protein
MKFKLNLDKSIQRPVITLNNGLTALLDTGAEIPVWTASENLLVRRLNAKPLNIRAPIKGYGGTTYGDVFRVSLQIGELAYPNTIIVANSELKTPFPLILSATMFDNLIYEIDNIKHCITITVPDDENLERNIVLTDSNGNRVVLSQSINDDDIKDFIVAK